MEMGKLIKDDLLTVSFENVSDGPFTSPGRTTWLLITPLLRLPALEHGEDVAATLKADEIIPVSAGVVATLTFRREVERPALTHPHLNVAEGLAKVAGALLDLPGTISPHQRTPGLNDLSLSWCCAEKRGDGNHKEPHQRMAQSLDPLCTGKGEGEVQPSGLDAVVLPALSGRAINVVLLMEACVLILVPTIGLGLNSRVKASWRNRCSAHSNSSKHHEEHHPWRSRFCRIRVMA